MHTGAPHFTPTAGGTITQQYLQEQKFFPTDNPTTPEPTETAAPTETPDPTTTPSNNPQNLSTALTIPTQLTEPTPTIQLTFANSFVWRLLGLPHLASWYTYFL